MSTKDLGNKVKGPAVTPKGTVPADILRRWGSSNLTFPVDACRRGKRTKKATELVKTVMRMREPGLPYTRLPANFRHAIAGMLTPMVGGHSTQGWATRRDSTGGETGEIVSG